MDILIWLFFIFMVLLIFFLMNKFSDICAKSKIKIYLLNCEELEKQVLKSIFTDNSNKEFLLTKHNPITDNIMNLNIAIEVKENSNNTQFSCILNLEILDLIKNDLDLKQMYLE
ncbi:MAG: hypothetical protein Q2306_00160 [Phytoplasma sp.]|uniref:hypothetical protein n=1 Tax=Phytoplasma sp. TaxID=2155 RepID=UPI002B405156|nr:hypothetical protein [Phytoplasma sp.]WRH06765.1 MAG: hypothetical protein Q2306_00160 [Phytoplasma sp.]